MAPHPLLASPPAGRTTFAATRHVPNNAQRTCLVAANVVMFMLNEI